MTNNPGHDAGRAPGHEPRSFAVEVTSLTALHASPFDALLHAQALRIVKKVLLHAIVKTNNQIANGWAPPEPSELLPDGIDVWTDIEDVRERLLRVAGRRLPNQPPRYWMQRAVSTIVSNRFRQSRYRSFLDTDEIQGLVAVAYGVGVLVRRELPELASAWMRDSEG